MQASTPPASARAKGGCRDAPGRFLCLAALKQNHGDLGRSLLHFTPDKQEGAEISLRDPSESGVLPHADLGHLIHGKVCFLQALLLVLAGLTLWWT